MAEMAWGQNWGKDLALFLNNVHRVSALMTVSGVGAAREDQIP
jgi:hypothetical protein